MSKIDGAAWLPDPAGSGQDRWWDGTAWTEELRPAAVTRAADGADAAQGLPRVESVPESTADPGTEGPGWSVPPVPTASVYSVPPAVSASGGQPPAASPGPVEPVAGPSDTEPQARPSSGRGPWVWATLASAVVAVVAVGALVVTNLGRDVPEPDALLSADPGSIETEPPAAVSANEGVEDGDEPASPSPSDGDAEDAPPVAEEQEDDAPIADISDVVAPDEELLDADDFVQPERSEVSSWELVDVLERYVFALDRGDLRGAHSELSPALQRRDGWSYDEWSGFWEGYLVGAEIVAVDEVELDTLRITAVVDYHLVGDEFSRELLVVGLVPSADGEFLIDTYQVLRAERFA
jgi:hypothetical protein